MPHQVSWYVPQRVIVARLYGVVTLEDVTQSNHHYMEHLHSTNERVHTLVDLSEIEKFPLNIPQIMKAMKVDRDREPGWALIIQKPNPVLQYVATMIAQIAVKHIRFRIMKDMPSAIQFLLEQDPTLDRSAFPSLTEQATTA